MMLTQRAWGAWPKKRHGEENSIPHGWDGRETGRVSPLVHGLAATQHLVQLGFLLGRQQSAHLEEAVGAMVAGLGLYVADGLQLCFTRRRFIPFAGT